MESYTSGDKWKQLFSKSNSLSLPIRGPIAFSSMDCEILKYEVKRIVLPIAMPSKLCVFAHPTASLQSSCLACCGREKERAAVQIALKEARASLLHEGFQER